MKIGFAHGKILVLGRYDFLQPSRCFCHLIFHVFFFSLMFAGVNRQPKSVDTYLALPRNSLGIGYVGASYTANIRSQIGIVGTLDDTRIRVTLPNRNNEPDFAVTVEHNGNINYMPYTRKFVWSNVSR